MKLFKLIAASVFSMGLLSMAVIADEPKDKVKVGFVYVGPTGDHGWTYRHDIGRQDVEKVYVIRRQRLAGDTYNYEITSNTNMSREPFYIAINILT